MAAYEVKQEIINQTSSGWVNTLWTYAIAHKTATAAIIVSVSGLILFKLIKDTLYFQAVVASFKNVFMKFNTTNAAVEGAHVNIESVRVATELAASAGLDLTDTLAELLVKHAELEGKVLVLEEVVTAISNKMLFDINSVLGATTPHVLGKK